MIIKKIVFIISKHVLFKIYFGPFIFLFIKPENSANTSEKVKVSIWV